MRLSPSLAIGSPGWGASNSCWVITIPPILVLDRQEIGNIEQAIMPKGYFWIWLKHIVSGMEGDGPEDCISPNALAYPSLLLLDEADMAVCLCHKLPP